MSGPPNPKRRRLTPSGDEPVAVPLVTTMRRKDAEIRTALQDLHGRLEQYSDVIVRVEGENGATEEFPCVSALLAASSRPLGAMLFGALRATTPHSGEERPRLNLRLTEPQHFRNLLLFIHGQDIPLEVEEAFQMHHVADFYEVLGLRDLCGGFLIKSLGPHNCCSLLARAHEVHCEPLAQRCLELLTLDFIAVVEHDVAFPALPPETLSSLCQKDELVCAEEYEVFEAIALWYEREPSAEKFAALPELLQLVRWPLVDEERRNEVFELGARLHPPRPCDVEISGATDTADADARARVGQKRSASPFDVTTPPRSDSTKAGRDASAARDKGIDADADAEGEPGLMSLLARVFPPSDASSSPASVTPVPRARQYSWGQLLVRPAPAAAEPDSVHVLTSTKEYMVGRSRKSDIRIGHQAPMPYISSQHCRIFHAIHWPDDDDEALPVAPSMAPSGMGALSISGSGGGSGSDAARAPRLQAWLEDLSQNGTFINQQPVGKGNKKLLSAGDRIEFVFPQGRQQPQGGNNFPVFTYMPHKPDAPTHSDALAEDAEDGNDGDTAEFR